MGTRLRHGSWSLRRADGSKIASSPLLLYVGNLRGWRRPHDLCRVGYVCREVAERLSVDDPCVLLLGSQRGIAELGPITLREKFAPLFTKLPP